MGSNEAKYREVEKRLWGSFGLQPTEQRLQLKNLGVTVRIQEVGEGPPVVLVHGGSAAGASWVNIVPRLEGFRLIILDRPGCGLSDPLPGGAGAANVEAVKGAADRLVPDLLDALELPKAHLLGNSFGGFFVIRAAAAAPERVDRVVLYSWSMGVPPDSTPLVMRFAFPTQATLPGSTKSTGQPDRLWHSSTRDDSQVVGGEYRDGSRFVQ